MPLRILHLVHQYPPHHTGGTELYTQALAQVQARQGYSVAIFCPSPDVPMKTGKVSSHLQPELEDGVKVYRVPIGARNPTAIFLSTFAHRLLDQAFTAVLAQEQPDLIHIQHLMGVPIDLVNRSRNARIPIVITLHDYWFFCANAQLLTNDSQQVCSGPRLWINCGRCALARLGLARLVGLAPAIAPIFAYRHLLLHAALEVARQIIVPTQFVRDAGLPMGLPVEKVRVVPHGIQTPDRVERTARGQVERAGLHVVYVGGLAFQKGIHVLIKAFNRLPHDQVRLSIYGDTHTFPAYVSELRQLAQHPGIAFAGRVARTDLWDTLRSADVIAIPSLWYEASPLVVHEAFAAGVPLIASNIGALRELVQDGVNGLLVSPGDERALCDAMSSLLSNPALLVRLRAGINPVRTIQDHANHIEMIYQAALRT